MKTIIASLLSVGLVVVWDVFDGVLLWSAA
jgi:hypothetical protein